MGIAVSPLVLNSSIDVAAGERPLAFKPMSFLVLASQTMAKRSPPIPHDIGSTTPRTALAAIAASTALPPCCKMSIAVMVASGWLVAAIPCRAITVERVLCNGPAGRSCPQARCWPFKPSHARTAKEMISKQDANSGR